MNFKAFSFPLFSSIDVYIGIYVLWIATHNSDINATVMIFNAIRYESDITPIPYTYPITKSLKNPTIFDIIVAINSMDADFNILDI